MVGQALPLTATQNCTSKGVHSAGGTFVHPASQANLLPEAWGLASAPSLSPNPLGQHIPEATKQTLLPHGPNLFPYSYQVGPGRLVVLWAWAHLISAWACILCIDGMASGSSGVREKR